MCGIAGIWELEGRKVERSTIRRFIAALAHRGPDGEGVLVADEGRLGLGHRRLAILDVSPAGEQPMRSASGRYDITYNGEVYNFLELRAELEQGGFRFHSNTDTEVILTAFERWGPDCLHRFNGMWAFAIWDRKQRRLFVARDRFGVKPLYMMRGPRRFAFASELKAFLHLDGFAPVADMDTVRARLKGNFSEGVLLQGVESLPAGYYLEVTPDGSRLVRWWNTLDHLIDVPQDFSRQADEFRELLFDACRLRLRSDVPIATSLSGGLDSSSVLCAVAAQHQQHGTIERQAPDWHKAFIAGFPGTSQDETTYAAMAAERADALPVLRQLSSDDFSAEVDSYLHQFEEIGGLYGAAAWALYREMRRDGVVVSLDGHGGDELLGGYDIHIVLALMRGRSLVTSPIRTLDLIDTLHQMYSPGGFAFVPNKALLVALTIPRFGSLAQRIPYLGHRIDRFMEALRRHSYDPDAVSADEAKEEHMIDSLGPLTGALYRSFHRHSLPRILRNFDAHSMGHGVEVRMPLLDWRLVRFCFSVPDASKVGGGYTKRLLREAMKGVLPEGIRLRRPKLGYNAPVAQWLMRGLKDWLWTAVNDPEFLRSELWNGRELLALAHTKRASRAEWAPAEVERITIAVTAHWWLTRWLRKSSSRPQAN